MLGWFVPRYFMNGQTLTVIMSMDMNWCVYVTCLCLVSYPQEHHCSRLVLDMNYKSIKELFSFLKSTYSWFLFLLWFAFFPCLEDQRKRRETISPVQNRYRSCSDSMSFLPWIKNNRHYHFLWLSPSYQIIKSIFTIFFFISHKRELGWKHDFSKTALLLTSWPCNCSHLPVI